MKKCKDCHYYEKDKNGYESCNHIHELCDYSDFVSGEEEPCDCFEEKE